jgi:hypothetical protein
MHTFPEQLPHGDIQEIFPDVFFVKGQIKFDNQGNTAQFSRSMTIVRDNGSLTIINSVRLWAEIDNRQYGWRPDIRCCRSSIGTTLETGHSI